MHAPQTQRPAAKKSRKTFWLKQLHMWHWMSSAISLIGLVLFAVTGFTLNHAADIEGTPTIVWFPDGHWRTRCGKAGGAGIVSLAMFVLELDAADALVAINVAASAGAALGIEAVPTVGAR